jgi:hypothetical protein
MVHITIEYMIMMPLLIMQIFLFPMAASWLMNVWVESRRTLALQEAASRIGSAVQQLYLSMHYGTMSGAATQRVAVPPFIENHPYIGNASLKTVLDPTLNSSRVLDLSFQLQGTRINVKASVILGQDVLWRQSKFVSNSTDAGLRAEKFANGTILLSFEGGG